MPLAYISIALFIIAVTIRAVMWYRAEEVVEDLDLDATQPVEVLTPEPTVVDDVLDLLRIIAQHRNLDNALNHVLVHEGMTTQSEGYDQVVAFVEKAHGGRAMREREDYVLVGKGGKYWRFYSPLDIRPQHSVEVINLKPQPTQAAMEEPQWQ